MTSPYLTHPARSLDDVAGYVESQLVTIRRQKRDADAALWAAQVHYDRLADEESKLERELESLHAELALRRYREEKPRLECNAVNARITLAAVAGGAAIGAAIYREIIRSDP